MKEKQIRTIARIISYRISALLLTALITGLQEAVMIHILLTVLHYAVEMFWTKIKWMNDNV
jgi:hypothetical protein